MPYQTVTSPCHPCRRTDCKGCEHRIYPATEKISDHVVENLWRENVNIWWDENEDGEEVLSQMWRGFPEGEFTQEDWFHWIDQHHSKGVGWVYENISPYDFEIACESD